MSRQAGRGRVIRPRGVVIPVDSVAFDAATLRRVRWCRRQLLTWYARSGRDLPWRSWRAGLYQKIVVEVLLQRTQARTVERFFPSFIRRFRSWSDVSAASIEDLGEVLRPIGLWRRRAGALKALASEMVRRRGSFPIDRRQIEALPAVGQYVASAVCGAAIRPRSARAAARRQHGACAGASVRAPPAGGYPLRSLATDACPYSRALSAVG
jgi:hypothetical protein